MADGSDLFRPLDGRLRGEGGRRFDHGRGAIQRRMIRPQGDQLVDGCWGDRRRGDDLWRRNARRWIVYQSDDCRPVDGGGDPVRHSGIRISVTGSAPEEIRPSGPVAGQEVARIGKRWRVQRTLHRVNLHSLHQFCVRAFISGRKRQIWSSKPNAQPDQQQKE